MSRGLLKAETAFESPTVVCRVTSFTTEFAEVNIFGNFLSPADVFLDDNFLGVIFVGRDVDNSNSGISYRIWSVSDWIVIGLND